MLVTMIRTIPPPPAPPTLVLTLPYTTPAQPTLPFPTTPPLVYLAAFWFYSDIEAERLVVWDPVNCNYGPGEDPIAQAPRCRAHDTDGCRFCREECDGSPVRYRDNVAPILQSENRSIYPDHSNTSNES